MLADALNTNVEMGYGATKNKDSNVSTVDSPPEVQSVEKSVELSVYHHEIFESFDGVERAERVFAGVVEMSVTGVLGGLDFDEASPSMSQLSGRLLGYFNQAFVSNGVKSVANAAESFVSDVEMGFAQAGEVVRNIGGDASPLLVKADEQLHQVRESVRERVAVQSLFELAATASSGVDDRNVIGENAVERVELYSSRQRARNFDFELKTQDGDRVSISFAGLQASSLVAGADFQPGSSLVAAYSGQVSLGSFELVIEGQLDESELAAISDLLGQVELVSESFFDGDLQSALEQALAIGFDVSEIASFSLDLMQVERRQLGSYYESGAESGKGFRPISKLGGEVAVMSSMLSAFEFEVSSLQSLIESTISEKHMLSEARVSIDQFSSLVGHLVQKFD